MRANERWEINQLTVIHVTMTIKIMSVLVDRNDAAKLHHNGKEHEEPEK